MTREGHCQLENIVSNLGVSHAFPPATPPQSVLGTRPREATSGLRHQGRLQLALSPGTPSTYTPPTAKVRPSRPVSPGEPGSGAPGTLGVAGREREPLLLAMELLHLPGRSSRDTWALEGVESS